MSKRRLMGGRGIFEGGKERYGGLGLDLCDVRWRWAMCDVRWIIMRTMYSGNGTEYTGQVKLKIPYSKTVLRMKEPTDPE